MNEHRNCTCPASKSGSFQIATDHYSRNFIPTGWKLEYTSLEQHEPQRFLYMTGWCLRCGGQDLQSGISIPDELSGAGGDPAPRLSQGRTPVVRGLLGSRRRPV